MLKAQLRLIVSDFESFPWLRNRIAIAVNNWHWMAPKSMTGAKRPSFPVSCVGRRLAIDWWLAIDGWINFDFGGSGGSSLTSVVSVAVVTVVP